jgi:hypothetical protein
MNLGKRTLGAKPAEAYWRAEGLDRLVEPHRAAPAAGPAAIAPQIEDLARLHRLVRARMATTVLEFGVGFSTLVLADALAKNEADYRALPNPPRLRNSMAFQLFSVDASEHWVGEARRRLPPALAPRCHIALSRVVAGTHLGRLCHYYEKLPNVVPDFVYLDGPAPADVEGAVNGLDFSIDERTVMAADLLLMESTLLPGAFILVDGRTNNARFLARNFQRPFRHRYDRKADITTFELVEPPLGRHAVDLVAARRRAQRRPRGGKRR